MLVLIRLFLLFDFDDRGSWAYGFSGVDNVAITTLHLVQTLLPTIATAITGNSATLSWVETGTATQWQVEYGTAGHTLGTGIKNNRQYRHF